MAVRQDSLRVVMLEAENFKRLRAVRIEPDADRNVVEITGRNGQGKSSTLDAIMAALCGGRAIPERAVRKGHDKATITVRLAGGDEILTVTRKITKSGPSLEITAKDGTSLRSPQAMLDAMLGQLAFDPLAFTTMEPREQIATIKAIAGLDDQFASLDAEAAAAQAELAAAKADEKRATAVAGATQSVDGPDDEVSLADLTDRLMEMQKQTETNRKAREWLETMKRSLAANEDEITKINEQISVLGARLKALSDAGAQMRAQIDNHAPKVEAMTDPDTSAIRDRIRTAEESNAAARKRREHRVAKAAAEAAAENVRRINRRKEDISARRESLLAECKLPVKGLTFTEEGVMLNGLPFANASSAEQVRASFAIAMAQNPRIRVALVRQGSLLDRAGKTMLAEIAAEHDAQVWMESVSNGEQIGIVIEDGEVREGGAR